MFYFAVGGFVTGVAIASLLTVSTVTMLFVMVLGFLLLVVARRHEPVDASRHLTLLAVALFAFTAGLLRTAVYETQFLYSPFDEQAGQEVLFSGTVVREPDVRERNTHVYLEHHEEVVLVTVTRHTPVAYGDELLVRGVVELPESFETDLGRTFDYPAYLEARGVTHLVRNAEITTISTGNGNVVIGTLLAVKQRLLSGIAAVIVEPQAGLAAGLLLGVKQALGDGLESAFRQSGIIHIVVLSGYNVMLVVAFFRFFMRPLPRWWQLVLGLLAITGFSLLVGLSATVMRATIMAGLVLLAGTLSRSYNVLRALFLAGAIMLLINPYLLLYDIGFQLSFIATLGLILVAPRLETSLAEGTWFGAKEFFLATVATQIAVLPLLLYHIGEVSVVAVLVNMLVLPLVPAAMLGSFIAGVLALLWLPAALPVAYLASIVLSYIILSATWFAALPFATIVVPAFPAWVVPLLYLAGGLGYWFIRNSPLTNALSDWEIVAEETLLAKPDPAPVTSDKDNTPVFFR